MGDLEDNILKRNIPGKWSKHEINDYDNDLGKRCGDNDIIDDNNCIDIADSSTPSLNQDDKLIDSARYLSQFSDIPDAVKRNILNERSKMANTGVKGVLADYNEAQKMNRAQVEADALLKKSTLNRMVEGYKIKLEEEELIEINPILNENSDDNNEFDDDDDEFMRDFRAKRFNDLKLLNIRPTYGDVKDLTTDNYLNEIDNEDKRTIIIVHLYDPIVQSCIRLNRMLEDLATSNKDKKFLRMHASKEGIEIDKIALPILNIYKGGELICAIVDVTNELGGSPYFNKEDIEWLLDSKIND